MTIRKFVLALCLLPLAAAPALADSDEGEEGEEHEGRNRAAFVVTDATTKTECSDCHIAYAPGFLPTRSWVAIMGNLSDHFGEDASLDPATTDAIQAYLVANSTDDWGKAAEGTPLRITELPWFKQEHGREVSKKALARAKSMSNCNACHQGADRGYFEDD